MEIQMEEEGKNKSDTMRQREPQKELHITEPA